MTTTRREPRASMVTSLENTLPPTRVKDLLHHDGASVLVYSHDADLSAVIKTAAGDQYPVRIINEWADLLRQIEMRESRIVLIDVDALTIPIDKALSQLHARADWLVILVAAKQQAAQEFMQLWSERRIHRMLIKPAAIGITRLLLESAINRFLELQDLYEHVDDDSLTIPSQPAPRFASARSPWRFVVTAALVAVLVGGGLWLVRRGSPETTLEGNESADVATPPPTESDAASDASADAAALPEPDDATTAVASEGSAAPAALEEPARSSDDARVAEQIERANVAAAQGNLTSPGRDGALDLYAAILRADPGQAEAERGLDALVGELYSRIEQSLLDGDLAAARELIATIRTVRPGDSRLAFLTKQLARQESAAARPSGAATRPAGSPLPPRAAPRASTPLPEEETLAAEDSAALPNASPSELDSLIAIATVRVEQGALRRPAGDSARDYLERAQAIDAGDPRVEALSERLRAELLATGRRSLESGDLAGTADLIADIGALGGSSEALARLDSDLSAALAEREAMEDERLAALVRERIDEGRLVESGGDSAVARLAALRERNQSYARLSELEEALANAIVSEARAAIEAQRWEDAAHLLEALETANGASEALGPLREELSFNERQAAYLAEPSPVGELELLSAAKPVYPRGAIARDVTGWVELEFVVDTAGFPRGVAVVDAEPTGEFEQAALDAVRQYEFVPFERDGRLYERRLRLRMRFEIN